LLKNLINTVLEKYSQQFWLYIHRYYILSWINLECYQTLSSPGPDILTTALTEAYSTKVKENRIDDIIIVLIAFSNFLTAFVDLRFTSDSVMTRSSFSVELIFELSIISDFFELFASSSFRFLSSVSRFKTRESSIFSTFLFSNFSQTFLTYWSHSV